MDISTDVRNGKLRILFSRSLSKTIFGLNNRKSFSLGLEDSLENKELTEQIVLEMENDIRANKFVKDLEYYLPKNKAKREAGIAYDPSQIKITLKELYTIWFEKKKINEIRSNAATYDIYINRISKIIERCPQDLNNQENIVDYIFANVDIKLAISLCSLLHNMFNWAKNRKTKKYISPEQVSRFKELSKDNKQIIPQRKVGKFIDTLMPEYVHDYRIKAFTEEEMYHIINCFYQRAFLEKTDLNGHKIPAVIIESRILAYYFICLKFMTGVRSGEASGLRFNDIADDNSYINIRHSWESRTKQLQKCLKTEKEGQEGTHARKLICDENLRLLIEELKKRYYIKPDDFVFKKKKIDYPFDVNNIKQYWYGNFEQKFIGVLPHLMMQKKVKIYLRPYNTRHTWINLQIQAGTNPLDICYAAGNTKEVMEMYYMSQPRPEDIVLKANIKLIH